MRSDQLTSRSTFVPMPVAAAILGVLIVLGTVLLIFLTPVAGSLTDAVVRADRRLLALLNGFSRQSRGFDLLVWSVSHDAVLQGGLLGALFCGAWFATGKPGADRRKRETLVSAFVGLYAAVLLSVGARAILPFRARPVVDPAFTFLAPYLPPGVGMAPTSTSFPSGHATVYFAFPAAFLLVSTTLGLLAFLHVLVVVSLPRMYLGLHYPTDILAGAVLSMATVVSVNRAVRGHSLILRLLAWSERHPGAFCGLLFFCVLDWATEFSTVRTILHLVSGFHLTRLVGS